MPPNTHIQTALAHSCGVVAIARSSGGLQCYLLACENHAMLSAPQSLSQVCAIEIYACSCFEVVWLASLPIPRSHEVLLQDDNDKNAAWILLFMQNGIFRYSGRTLIIGCLSKAQHAISVKPTGSCVCRSYPLFMTSRVTHASVALSGGADALILKIDGKSKMSLLQNI